VTRGLCLGARTQPCTRSFTLVWGVGMLRPFKARASRSRGLIHALLGRSSALPIVSWEMRRMWAKRLDHGRDALHTPSRLHSWDAFVKPS
jgi:hypothetical protein